MSSPPTTATNGLVEQAQSFVNTFNMAYEVKHRAFEHQFWGTKMALSDNDEITYSVDNLSQTKQEMEDLLSNPEHRATALSFYEQLMVDKEGKDTTEDTCSANNADDGINNLLKTLRIIIRTCDCYDMSAAPQAKALREQCSALEGQLEQARNQMTLGYTTQTEDGGIFTAASSVALRNVMRTASDESVRKAAYEGLRSIGPFCLQNGFIEIIKLRNQMAKILGYIDYYDYKVSNAEGFGKEKLFVMLDGLERGTRPIMEQAYAELVKRYGTDALLPWNTGYKMAGSIIAKMDPYFPFGKSVERYMRSYAALGISYRGATMHLDLLDRPHKHSNGFCHWPQPAWRRPDGSWQPSTTHFTSLADPNAIGSGYIALQTLMHEAGHAAHFANIDQPSPLFSQERAPTSVPYAENQSMFLDSLIGDAAWRAKYARSPDNDKPMPFDIMEEEIRAVHPFAVFQLRAMLSVSYFEKALYELPDDEVTADNIQQLADKIEMDIQGAMSGRPLLSIPHLISDEASCYYHGYTLAEMSVHQTRSYFLNKYGYIVDNPHVGPELTNAYWKAGNSRPFLELVHGLTGKELSGDDWVAVLRESVEDKVSREREAYDAAIIHSTTSSSSSSTPDDNGGVNVLDMTVKFVDGDTVIADSSSLDGGILEACRQFESFVAARIAATTTTNVA